MAYGHPLELEEDASGYLAGGILSHGYQCGMVWGATLAAGAQAYQLFGPGQEAETRAIVAANKLVESFRIRNEHINCLEITDIDQSSSAMKMITFFLIKGGAIGCFRMASRYAPDAYCEINTALSDSGIHVPSPPVSCAAMLAQKMGVSELHGVMAAGFAGGIGLCGGACGALGAAIWIVGMNRIKEGNSKIGIRDARASALIERFLKTTDHEFECTEIVGRKFENVDDHASYLREGGCSRIIEVLATA